jgi:hypothetical protein
MMATKLVFRLVNAAVFCCAVCICVSGNTFAAGPAPASTIEPSKTTTHKAGPARRDTKTQKTPDKKTGSPVKILQPGSTGTTPLDTAAGDTSPVTHGSQFHRESTQRSSTSRPGNTAVITTKKNEDYHIDARIFISGEAARKKGKTGFSQLKNNEKELTAFLGYRDYRLIKESEKTIKIGNQYVINIDKTKSVTVTPLSESPARVKLAIEWKIPGEEIQRWKKLLYFKRNHRSLIGGPHIEGGGMYLLSLEIQ